MSWQAYVDTSLVGTGHFDKAAIFSIQGDSVWATSAGFSVTPQEMQAVASKISSGALQEFFATGIHVGGEKFVTIKADTRTTGVGSSLYGKKGREGIIICSTKQAILIGHYPESVQPGQAAQTTEALADYLVSVGY